MRIYEDQLIVITGGVGFIGSCLVRYLNDLGMTNLVLVDDLGMGDKWRNLSGKNVVDVLHKGELFTWLEGREQQIEAIIHLGACSKTVEQDANYLLNNNFRYSQRLADYAINHEIRFIYASSAATYGDGLEGFSDNEAQLHTLRPLNMYGMSKQLFDQWLLNAGLLGKVTGLKFFNVFGPNEYHKGRMASAITHILPTAQKEGVVKLFKSNDPHFVDGGQQRDFIYVKDVVRMVHAFLLNDATGIYNVGSGIPSTWNELAAAVFKAIDAPVKIEYISMPADLHGKYQNYTCADMAKTKAALGDAAVCQPLETSIIEYVRDYLLTGKIW
jgi:ADP-L-glycero-D-manno-heptose 6-epimerase